MRYISILILILITISTASSGQVYNVKGLDGVDQKVRIVADYPHNALNIICLKDTLRINEFLDLHGKAIVLNGQFLKVIYDIRGGSDETGGNMVLLCVAHNKLYQAMHVTSFSTYDVDRVYNKRADSLKLFDEHGDYGLNAELTGTNKANYKLVVNIHDEVKSKHDPKTNHNDKEQVSLNFDPDNYIFYNAHEDISQYFTIYDPKTQRAIKQYLLGSFPVIQLGNYKYYYIKDEWYGKGHDDNLLKYAYK